MNLDFSEAAPIAVIGLLTLENPVIGHFAWRGVTLVAFTHTNIETLQDVEKSAWGLTISTVLLNLGVGVYMLGPATKSNNDLNESVVLLQIYIASLLLGFLGQFVILTTSENPLSKASAAKLSMYTTGLRLIVGLLISFFILLFCALN